MDLTISGWGKTIGTWSWNDYPNVLQVTNLVEKPFEECATILPQISNRHICGFLKAKGICGGDSGGTYFFLQFLNISKALLADSKSVPGLQLYTVKLGYNKPLGPAKFVRYNREFNITGIVYGITH